MISLTTGTKVPRRASSLNSSNVVCFMPRISLSRVTDYTDFTDRLHGFNGSGVDCRSGGAGEQATGWTLSRPDLELPLGLGDQHLEAADRLAAGRRRGLHQGCRIR